MQPRAAAAVDALCFNVDSDIDRRLQLNLRRTGTIHIVSASGLHIVIVAFALLWLLERLPVPRGLGLALVAAALFLYVGAAGLNPPVIRAAVTAMLVLGAYLFRREPDWLSAMAIAALGCLIARPSSAMEAGFQLSFAVIAGLGLFGRRFYGGVRALARLWTGFENVAHVALVASVVSAPLVAYHFGMVSVASVLANVLIGFVIAPIVIAALVAQAVSPFSAALAVGLMKLVVEPLSGWFLWVVDSLGQMRWAAVDAPPFSAYWLLPIYAAMLCLWRKRVREA
jgi:competence protein ComEC